MARTGNDSTIKIVANKFLDLSNEDLRNKFFARVLQSYENEIYSFSFAVVNGEYYGARRDENGEYK